MAVLRNPNHMCWWKDINPHKVKSYVIIISRSVSVSVTRSIEGYLLVNTSASQRKYQRPNQVWKNFLGGLGFLSYNIRGRHRCAFRRNSIIKRCGNFQFSINYVLKMLFVLISSGYFALFDLRLVWLWFIIKQLSVRAWYLSLKRDLFTDVTKIISVLILFDTKTKTLLHSSIYQTSFSDMSSFIKI